MNTKPFGIKVGTAGLALALAGVGCSGAEGDGAQGQGQEQGATQQEAATPTAPVQMSPHSAIIHATVSLGEDHVVQFVEHQPGMFGLIEIGRAMIDVPRVTPEVTQLTWTDQYHHFAGPSVPLPQAMVGALARASLLRPTTISKPPTTLPTLSPLGEDTGKGPHFYTAGEQTWFNQTFCNGAEICIQGFDWTNMQTPGKISHFSAFGMIGAEGTTNGNMKTYYWACGGFGFFPTVCYWFECGNTVIVPGHFINVTLSQQSSSWFFRWELRGGGANTLVSTSADF